MDTPFALYTTKIDYSHNYFILKEKIGLDF